MTEPTPASIPAPGSVPAPADLATAVSTVRFLAVDMVEAAKSGHPGAPLGQAPLATTLWTRQLRFDPADPQWPARDRFVLSCGHASALLYALLHLSGYDLAMDELRHFRQLGSRCPGHPEHELTPGVETTTGPLGQGFANAVGMAIAQRHLAARYEREGFPIFAHRVWALASDGDMMEGISHEAASLAGHLRLGNLKVFYDDNGISIDGETSLAFSEDVPARFAAYGWRVMRVEDGNDMDALAAAVDAAAAEDDRPMLVAVRTHIGFGSPHKQDTSEAHGSPLGPEETRLTKQALGWPTEPAFLVPEEGRAPFAAAAARGAALHRAWNELFARYKAAYPELAAELEMRWRGELPAGWESALPRFGADQKPIATRSVSGKVLAAVAPRLPFLVGGSADLTPSNNTLIEGGDFAAGHPEGRYFRFGIREHAMGAVMNGMALSRVLVPYGGTFLVFSDYMRPAIRLAALMRQQVVYVFTHDSIFLGEDGPTHQPVSQLASLRSIPGLTVIRPADAHETVAAWKVALSHNGPTALALSRQNLPVLAETAAAEQGLARGGYVVADGEGEPAIVLIATGSELALALGTAAELRRDGVAVRVVSLPSWELFAEQPQAYRDAVLPPGVRTRLAIEAGSPFGWERWVGLDGDVLAQETFGASAPAADLAKHFGFTVEAATARARALLAR